MIAGRHLSLIDAPKPSSQLPLESQGDTHAVSYYPRSMSHVKLDHFLGLWTVVGSINVQFDLRKIIARRRPTMAKARIYICQETNVDELSQGKRHGAGDASQYS
jgi:hypothetical protein